MQSDRMPDFSRRISPSGLAEWMDEPCSYEDFRHCLQDLGQVNRLTLSYRPTLNFLDRLIERRPQKRTLRILDVGCGGGDMLRQVQRWAAGRGVDVTLTGIDLNPYAARAASELAPNAKNIEWITGDVFSYPHAVDVILSSLFTHHLEEEEIVRYLSWSEKTAESGWFVNDLYRDAAAYQLFGYLASVMRWHRFVKHDGPVSFLRSFREDDWYRILDKAGIAGPAVRLRRWRPARLCVEHIK